MKGDTEVISILNEVLCNELSAINQYFLHARMLENWGMTKMGKEEYDSAIDEMKHGDDLIKRILFIEGLPNLQKMNRLNIGENVEEVLKADLKLEMAAVPVLKKGIELCENKRDYVSRDLLVSILESEEEHIDWLETNLELVGKMGLQNFIQTQVG